MTAYLLNIVPNAPIKIVWSEQNLVGSTIVVCFIVKLLESMKSYMCHFVKMGFLFISIKYCLQLLVTN